MNFSSNHLQTCQTYVFPYMKTIQTRTNHTKLMASKKWNPLYRLKEVNNQFNWNDTASNVQKGQVFLAETNSEKAESFVDIKWQFHSKSPC